MQAINKALARHEKMILSAERYIWENPETGYKEYKTDKYMKEKFRELEAEAIREASAKTGVIIATGGGAILKNENVRALKRCGRLFFIDRPLESLVPTDSRPLSSDKAAIAKRYEERYPIYSSVCDERIDATCDAEAVAEKILENFL